MTHDAGVLQRQPINRNFLSQLDFKFVLHRAPALDFFLQEVNLPGINIPQTYHPNPFTRIPYSGEHITFQPLGVRYKVDEDFANYFEIHNWLYGLGFPQNFGQYGELLAKPAILGEALRSDISVMILNSVKRPNIEITFHECFPTSLSDLVFSTTPTDVDFLTALATFTYVWYDINRI